MISYIDFISMISWQNIQIFFLIILTVIAFFRVRGENSLQNIAGFFAFGIILILIGSILVYIFNDENAIINNILMKKQYSSGMSVFIGYGFVLMSIFLAIDHSIQNLKSVFKSRV